MAERPNITPQAQALQEGKLPPGANRPLKEGQEEIPSEEEFYEELFWQSVLYAREAIFETQTDQMMQIIENADDKPYAVGKLTADLLGFIIRDGVAKGQRFSRPTVKKFFQTIISDLAEFATAKGILQFQAQAEVDKFVNYALVHAVEEYAKQVKSKINGNPGLRDQTEQVQSDRGQWTPRASVARRQTQTEQPV